MRKCRTCESEFGETETQCPVCKFPFVPMTACGICGAGMPEGAQRCNKCESYQGGWRRLPISTAAIALVTSVLAVFTALEPAASHLLNLESHTRFKMTGADDLIMSITVWNTGEKPSALVGCRLSFGDLPIEDVRLQFADEAVVKAKNVIFHGPAVRMGVTVDELEPLKPGRREKYTKDDIRRLLDDHPNAILTLKVDVEESSDDPDRWRCMVCGRSVHTRSDTLSVTDAKKFILGRMSG